MYGSTTRRAHRGDPVSRVMSWPVAVVQDDTTLEGVAEELAADEVGLVLVLSGGRLAGVVSERDLVAHAAVGADLTHLNAADVMTTEPVTVESAATVLEAAQAMRAADVRHLPVMEGDRIAGVLSMRDLFAVLVDDVDDDQVVVVPSGTRVVVRAE
jgi:CBS domain-containing protein